MLKLKFLLPLLAIAALTTARAGLQPGAEVQPYEIHNTASGKEYCQMCAFGAKAATVAAYGKLGDAQFWSDLEKLEAIHKEHANIGVFGQVLDSTDAAAIQAQAAKHGITFPVVYAKDPNWENVYKVGGVSRTVYYSKNFKIDWSGIGLDDKSLAVLERKVASDAKS
jgi:hypothetical protein